MAVSIITPALSVSGAVRVGGADRKAAVAKLCVAGTTVQRDVRCRVFGWKPHGHVAVSFAGRGHQRLTRTYGNNGGRASSRTKSHGEAVAPLPEKGEEGEEGGEESAEAQPSESVDVVPHHKVSRA